MKEKTGWLKTDAHTHSRGVSRCSRVEVKELLIQKKKSGYDAVVLTNHTQPWYYPPEENARFIGDFIEEYETGRDYGEQIGVRVFLGIEVTVLKPFYSDWLLYGVTEEFLRAAPCLHQLSQKELFKLCKHYGIVLVQAHPYRMERIGDAEYMHGMEINCTPGDLETYEKVGVEAAKRGFLITCGTDYHGPERTFRGGMYIPDWVRTAKDFGEYLKNTDKTHIFLEDLELEFPVPSVAKAKF